MTLSYLLSIVATTMESTACLICARYLWSVREQTRDRSRLLLALGSLISGILAIGALSLSIGVAFTDIPPRLLQPWIGLICMALNIVMTLYPISVVQPGWLSRKRLILLFLPVGILAVIYVCLTGHWTEIFTPYELWARALEPNVLVRLTALLLMPPYCFILFFLNRNYRHSSATFWWMINYSVGLLVLCVVHIALMLTYSVTLVIVLPVLAALFFLFSTEFELNDRLHPDGAPQPETALEENPAAHQVLEPDLWARVTRIMDAEEAWRDPDLSLVSLARMCATNVTYLNRVIQEKSGSGFKDLINQKRIACVVKRLREHPDTDIQTAFFDAGYRSRTTAWRNFKDIMGVTPTEFRQRM